jgi:hypothetical protein
MVYRVVSTKLTEEEHSKLLELCNQDGCTPFAMLKKMILDVINSNTEFENHVQKDTKKESKELRIAPGLDKPKTFLGIKKSVCFS